MPRRSDWWEDFPPPSTPLPTTGGIKLQGNTRDTSWWAKRWLAVLESFDLGTQLARGRAYACKGQVLAIQIVAGKVTAQVQGSRPRPYQVRITLPTLTATEQRRVIKALAAQPVFTAQLLNGVMPQDIESAFVTARVPLFPMSLQEIETTCSCPDWSNPCKHLAAVYYLLGQEFDRDPFLLFTLRGLSRPEVLAQLSSTAALRPKEEPVGPLANPALIVPHDFWHGREALALPPGTRAAPPPVPAALLCQLGPFPFWRGEQDLRQTLEPVYSAAATRATALRTTLAEQSPTAQAR